MLRLCGLLKFVALISEFCFLAFKRYIINHKIFFMKPMATYFISDLHLDSSFPHLTKLFFNFLENELNDAEKLYILGDLFEVWIGDDHQCACNQQIIAALNTL